MQEGILQHLPALLAVSTPTVNSFRRIGRGCWTGYKIGWATEDKESPLRVCLTPFTNEACNVEMKLSDSTANVYLELAAILSAGLDGISRNLDLRPPHSTATSATEHDSLPSYLSDALTCLENDSTLVSILGAELTQAYCALRRAEITNADNTNMAIEDALQEEVRSALAKA